MKNNVYTSRLSQVQYLHSGRGQGLFRNLFLMFSISFFTFLTRYCVSNSVQRYFNQIIYCRAIFLSSDKDPAAFFFALIFYYCIDKEVLYATQQWLFVSTFFVTNIFRSWYDILISPNASSSRPTTRMDKVSRRPDFNSADARALKTGFTTPRSA